MYKYVWAKRQSSSGSTYYVPEETMPVINYVFLQLVFYIYPSKTMAEENELGATGTIIAVKSDERAFEYIYAVTNAHVIENFERLGVDTCALRFNTKDNKTEIIETSIKDWDKHPKGDDLAAYPLEPAATWRFAKVTEKTFLMPEDIKNHNIGIGDDTWTIGKYSFLQDNKMNLPTVRFGHISMLPLEEVHQGKHRDFEQLSYLVETHSISGYSGSPVFTQIDPDGRTAKVPLQESKTFLVGIDWGHFDFEGHLIDPDTKEVKVPSGMMCVVPAWKIKELLDIEKFKMQRKALDKQAKEKAKKSGANTDMGITKDEFENTLKKVSRKTKTSQSDSKELKT